MLAAAAVFARDVPQPVPRPPEYAAPHAHGSPVDLDIPLPPVRPADAGAAPAPPSSTPPVASDKDIAACKALFESGTVVARTVAAIRGVGGCGVDMPVVLETVILPNGRFVKFDPAPTMRCDLAAALSRWVRNDVDPLLAAQNLTLERIANAESYACRGRNRVAGAKLSEHGKGNAIDLDAFVVAPARRIPLTGAESAPFAATLRSAACARFSTVLGPGSDGYHDTHIHLDLEDRRTHGTLCQWRLP